MSIGRRIAPAAAAALIAVSGMYAPALGVPGAADTALTASAAETITPELKAGAICGDKLILYIDNYNSYSDSASFVIRISGNKVKTVSGKSLKSASGKLSFTTNGKIYLNPYTRYTVRVTVTQNGSSSESQIKLQTAKHSYYTVKKGTVYYNLSGGSMTRGGTLGAISCEGVVTDSAGNAVKGQSISTKTAYVKLAVPVKTKKNENNEQLYTYKYVYVKTSDASRKSIESARNTVVNYALKMSDTADQQYVLCGETFTGTKLRSDCSGMTKLSYLKIGYYLEHIAESQANIKGTKLVFNNIEKTGKSNGVTLYRLKDSSARVDVNSLEKGDLLFFLCSTNNQSTNPEYVENGIGHVAMYIGGGKFVHFTASYGVNNHPCRTENLRSYENSQLKVVRVIRMIY